MTGAADAELARRDPALPGLALLLDADAFAEALDGALPIAGVQSARAVYVRYKPATSCLVAYKVVTGGVEHDVYARAHRPTRPEKLGSARRGRGRRTPLGPAGIVLERHAVAVHVFPHDRRLGELPRLVRDGARMRTLHSALPGHPELWKTTATTLRYNPERRWVARLDGHGGARAVLKAHTGERFGAVAAVAAAIAGQSGLPRAGEGPDLPIARVLGVAPRAAAVICEWLDGRPLDALLREAHARDAAGPVAGEGGAALAALHRARAPRLVARRADETADALRSAADAVGAVLPHLAARATELARRLGAGPPAGAAPCPTHGDCSADQMIAGPGGVRLLDLDRAAQDDPASDLGAFVADLEARALRGELPPAAAAGVAAALLDGYRAAGGPGATAGPALARQVAAGLLLRAPEPFRTRDPQWAPRTEALLAGGESVAASHTFLAEDHLALC